jgi:hypothetical protein
MYPAEPLPALPSLPLRHRIPRIRPLPCTSLYFLTKQHFLVKPHCLIIPHSSTIIALQSTFAPLLFGERLTPYGRGDWDCPGNEADVIIHYNMNAADNLKSLVNDRLNYDAGEFPMQIQTWGTASVPYVFAQAQGMPKRRECPSAGNAQEPAGKVRADAWCKFAPAAKASTIGWRVLILS